jgi:triosephosphate isomerase
LHDEAIALARGVRERSDAVVGVEKIICPPFVFLHEVAAVIAGSTIRLGAQHMHWDAKGAFTGEVSVAQIAEVAQYVIIGHSERRQHFSDTDERINRCVGAALAHGLKPIMCVGETLEQRQRGETADVLVRQTRAGIGDIKIDREFIMAYEPVWAIGTGHAADAATAEEAIALIRSTVRQIAGDAADSIRILYGGSVTPENIAEFMREPDIDGGLIGGASLKAESFAALVEGAAAVSAGR